MSRPAVPAPLKRRLYEESGYRCAIPTCRSTSILEMAHIVPWEEVQDHAFENMIVLCAMCHGLYDREKKIHRKSIETYKANLGLMNARYNETERRLLREFLASSDVHVITSVDRFQVANLIDDGHIIAHEGKIRHTFEIYGEKYSVPLKWIYQITRSGTQVLQSLYSEEPTELI